MKNEGYIYMNKEGAYLASLGEHPSVGGGRLGYSWGQMEQAIVFKSKDPKVGFSQNLNRGKPLDSAMKEVVPQVVFALPVVVTRIVELVPELQINL